MKVWLSIKHMLARTGHIYGGIAIFILAEFSASGTGFRLSFIDEKPVLEETCRLLKENGFSEDSVAKIKKLVEEHNRPGNRVDRTKFPPLLDGYYHFQSFADLTNRAACAFFETPGSNEFPQTTLMCFDVAGLLLRGAGCEAPRLEDGLDSKRFIAVQRDGSLAPVAPEKFRTATAVLYPANGYEVIVGQPRSEVETQIGLSLRAKRLLLSDYTNTEKDLRSVFATQIRDVKRDGFKFPENCKIGLGYFVNTKQNYIWGDHAFICIKKRGRFVCLEKNGTKGPYVRIEFDSEKDIDQYMSWGLLLESANPKSSNYCSSVLISLNDRLIGVHQSNIKP